MIVYTHERSITVEQLACVFDRSGIHRPTNDLARLQEMLDNADVLWTAWEGECLVGVARALTDFSYACYLSDLAVDKDYQRQGIGSGLVDRLRRQLGSDVSLVLLAAQSAMEYYPKLGFNHIDNAFLIARQPF
ncbi:GNAT family N-acetyltransferase [Bifidobacterium sp. ESL0784]|uniref:GNAT family N-acetyltransferase n=1 Tax=Bifidobacterium sp. ESL0784 TaxID=2983231 RepID=UPI0023F894D8|nr:GNAT family N-acetyltransferase [Bifidobacterium sp. ESL0784]MDF7641221.1 GNAT family N-acetyltransferase [Bifidobacterium sp. ESL0784]